MQIHLLNLIDEQKCYKQLREIRWVTGVYCPRCDSNKIHKRGRNSRHKECQRYECKKCNKRFDDLTGTVFSKRHQSLSVWVIFLHLLGLNLQTLQIAQELGLNPSDSLYMAEILRNAAVRNKPLIKLHGYELTTGYPVKN